MSDPVSFSPFQERAAAVSIPLSLVPALSDYKGPGGTPGDTPPLGLRGAHQATNAALAVSLAGAFEGWAVEHASDLPSGAAPAGAASRVTALAKGALPAEYASGLETCAWHGRAEVVHDGGAASAATSALSFYLDGAHTPESMETCAHWFASEVKAGGVGATGAAAAGNVAPATTTTPTTSDVRLLLFNCMHERDPRRLLTPLTDTLRARGAPLAGALFVPPDSSYSQLGPAEEAKVDLSWQHSLQAVWADLASAGAAAAATAAAAGQRGGGGGGAGPSPCLPPLPPLPPSPTRAESGAASARAAATTAAAREAAAGAVSPSVKSAIEWLRSASQARPGVRLRVLVTGSLYLVGDVLRHLGRAEEGGGE